MSTGAIIALYILGVVVTVGVVKLLLVFTTSEEIMPRITPQSPTPSELLRVLVIHCQWLYIISTLVGVPWPASLLFPMQVLGGIWSSTSGSSIGIECIMAASRGLPVAMQRMLIRLLTPLGIMFIVLAIEYFARYMRPTKDARLRHEFASVAICIVFMFMPIWVGTVLSMFTCIPLDSVVDPPYQATAVGSYWLEEMSQPCYSSTGYHKKWALGLGAPLTVLFCLALPLGVFTFMWISRKRGKLSNTEFKKHYGFIFKLWRDEVCWWESVHLAQTIALVMVSTFGFAMGAFYQSLVATAVLVLVANLLLVVKPYKCLAANNIAALSVYVLFLTTFTALTFLPYNNITPGPVYGNIMGVVILMANLAFLMYTTYKLAKSVDWEVVKSWLSKLLSSNAS
jgi:hypothetical protein